MRQSSQSSLRFAVGAVVWLGLALFVESRAQDASCCAPPPPPGPYYAGCLCCRSTLTGDWCGSRTCLAGNGITFQGDVTQYYQGVAEGGLRELFRYGGHADYLLNFDLGKLAGQEGLFLKVRGESQFGEFVNADTGALIPVNTEGLLPAPGNPQQTALTNVLLTQFLSPEFAVFAGKLDTLDGDRNAFAHGRGKDQFLNNAFVVNPVMFRNVPYSTYGAGFMILEGHEPILSFLAIDPVEHATLGPTDLFAEGVTLAGELRLPTRFFGLPGHQGVGGTWSSREVPNLGRFTLPPGAAPATLPDSWSLSWNFDQYLIVDPCNPARGWGLFGRAGLADDRTNPLSWFLSFGVGGSSPIARRPTDTFGVGWYYAPVSDELPQILLSSYGQGVELYYNIAVTKWLHLTLDAQFIDPALRVADDAIVLGARAKLDL